MNIPRNLIVAIDGYSSCGKSTFAKAIAQKYGLIYIDTGAMYRAVTLFALNNDIIGNDYFDKDKLISQLPAIHIEFRKHIRDGKVETFLNNENVEEDIRDLRVSSFVSTVSSVKEVREKMVELQRKMGKDGGVVLDGRDIGTVVFPQAQIKIFMTADPYIRAKRRFDELMAKGDATTFEEVYQNIIQRDYLDTTRSESPLTKASDAIVLDNSHITIEEQLKWFDDLLKTKYGK
jgi:cytidylate kinase